MTEKRFTSEDYIVGYYTGIVDNEKILDETLPNPSQRLLINEAVDLLNMYHERNQELEQDLNQKIKCIAKQKSESIVEVDFDEFIRLCKDSNDLTEANERIQELEQEIQELKHPLEYSETISEGWKENKLYIKDTNTTLKMENDYMYICCKVPFKEGTEIRKYKFRVAGIYNEWIIP